MFLISQSIIIAIAILLSALKDNHLFLLFILEFTGIVELWFWYSICRARANDVSYFQMKIMEVESTDQNIIPDAENHAILTMFKIWQSKSNAEKVQLLILKKLNKSRTRSRMDKVLPLLFLILWIAVDLKIFTSFLF